MADSILGLDRAEVGERLMAIAIASRQLGHAHVASTARDYIAPHAAGESPEMRFVLAVLTGRTDDAVPESDVIAIARADDWAE